MNYENEELIDVYVPWRNGELDDGFVAPPGVRAHRGPALHPDDTDEVDGLPVTSVSRTLIDVAEVMTKDELRECFLNAREQGLLDFDAIHASLGRVEWRPSLAMFYEVLREFGG